MSIENNVGCGRLELRKGKKRKMIFGCECLAEGSVKMGTE